MTDYNDFTVYPPEVSEDEKLLAMLIYLGSFVTTFVGPLIIWLIKRESSEFVDFHGKQYFNFLISYFIYSGVCVILMLIIVGFVLIFVVGIAAFILTIMACVKAYGGEKWKIPLVIRFIN